MSQVKIPYFLELVQIYNYLFTLARNPDNQLPQSIRLMQFEQLQTNISYNKQETQLIKDILICLLERQNNGAGYQKDRYVSSLYLTISQLKQSRIQILNKYYSAIAIEEYLCSNLKSNEEITKYMNCNFYELDKQEKTNIISYFITNSPLIYVPKTVQVQQKKEEYKGRQTKSTGSKSHIVLKNQISCLGMDKEAVYFFIGFLPWSIFYVKKNNWFELTRQEVVQKMLMFLQMKPSHNLLFLLKNMSTIEKQYMIDQKPKHKKLPIHKVKNPLKEKESVDNLKNQFRRILNKYSKYLKQIDPNYRLAPVKQQNSLQEELQSVKSLQQMKLWFQKLYRFNRKGIYFQNKQKNQNCKFIIWANMFCKSSLINRFDKLSVKNSNLAQFILSDQVIDWKPKLQIMAQLLTITVDSLEQKQKKYFQNLQRRKTKLNRTSNASISSINTSNGDEELKISMGRQLRRRPNAKKFGVTMIDSDDETSIQKKLRSYSFVQ